MAVKASRGIDAVLLLGFGGPERPEEVRPFLELVCRGKNLPEARIRAVEEQYRKIGGSSPYHEITRKQASALGEALAERGYPLPVLIGMRHWHPFIREAVQQVKVEGLRRLGVVILSVAECEASWDRYILDLRRAMNEAGLLSDRQKCHAIFLPPLGKLPGFAHAQAQRVAEALRGVPASERACSPLVFTAHSIPLSMAAASPYEAQLRSVCQEVSRRLGQRDYLLAFQSRSGPPAEPWLEPDVGDVLRRLAAQKCRRAVLIPIGFVCDHAEVLYDLDVKARIIAREVGIQCLRAGTVGDHPLFVANLAQTIIEQLEVGA